MDGAVCASCSIGLTNVAETPLWARDATEALVGSPLDKPALDRAVAAAEALTSPASDPRGPAEYRTKMAGLMLRRAVERAKSRGMSAASSRERSGRPKSPSC